MSIQKFKTFEEAERAFFTFEEAEEHKMNAIVEAAKKREKK